MPTQPVVRILGRVRGWAMATLSAGLIYPLVLYGIGSLRLAVPDGGVPGFAALLGIAFAIISTMFLMGLLAGFFGVWMMAVPIAVLVWAVGWLGTRHRLWRLPVAWGAVGVAAGMPVAINLGRMRLEDALVGAITGAAVAAIARRSVRWIDPTCSPTDE